MRILMTVVFMSLFMAATAQNYAVSAIPDSLREKADVVKRLEQLTVTIKSIDKIVTKHKYAITVFNEAGDDFAAFQSSYSTMEKITDISGTLYDAQGNKIRSVKRKEIEDEPVTDGFSLMLDTRIKAHHFRHRQYPYTIEYQEESERNNSYFLPAWHPVEGDEMSVQQSSFHVEVPSGFVLRYRQYNFVEQPVIQTNDTKQYHWEIKNFRRIGYEPFRPSLSELLPSVYIGLGKFSLGDYKGEMSTWEEFGKLQLELNRGRGVLPEAVKIDIHNLVDNINDKQKKVERLYQYLQTNTRYISIQLGIGGWQPFDAQYVAKNKYGDCKALSNYMVAILKEAGIKANYVLVTAGKDKKGLDVSFPAPYFNHVIVCVPGEKDSTWLECTSKNNAAGYMGSFTGDREVLLIDDDGGHVVKTPKYDYAVNTQDRNINIAIDEMGNASASLTTISSGLKQELPHNIFYDATAEEKNKYLNQAFKLGTYKVNSFSYEERKGIIPQMSEKLSIDVPNYASVSGKRFFITPNLFSKSTVKMSTDYERKFPVAMQEAYTELDSVQITIPLGYIPEAVPKDYQLERPYGAYSIRYIINNNRIIVYRKQVRKKMTLPASAYNEVAEYFNTIFKMDQNRIVFVKKEG